MTLGILVQGDLLQGCLGASMPLLNRGLIVQDLLSFVLYLPTPRIT